MGMKRWSALSSRGRVYLTTGKLRMLRAGYTVPLGEVSYILDILLGIDGVDVDGKDEEGYTALFLAARWGREATVELLIDKYGANPEVGNGGMEWTSLHGAVIFGESVTARMLLARGANPNSRDVLSRTPLSLAVNVEWEDNGDTGPPMVRLLLEADGVDIDIQDIGDRAPLVWAIMSALYLVHALDMVDMYEASIQLLIEKGARVDGRDRSGRTPIFYAAMLKRAALAQRLLEKDAEPDCRDTDSRIPLSYAVEPFNVTWLAKYEDEREDEWEPEWSV